MRLSLAEANQHRFGLISGGLENLPGPVLPVRYRHFVGEHVEGNMPRACLDLSDTV